MKKKTIILKSVFWILILMLLVLPLYLIYQISKEEMAEYKPPESPVLREVSVGEPTPARRMDVKESVTVTGTFTSRDIVFAKLAYQKPEEIHWIISQGDEIEEGQVIGYYKEETVTAPMSGIVLEIHTYPSSDAYLKIRTFTPLVLSCQVSNKVLSALQREPEKLITEDGIPIRIRYIGKVKNQDGTSDVDLEFDSDKYSYGEYLENQPIYTGISYPQVLTLNSQCVYQKDKGENEPWYVRQVSEDGEFIAEIPVKISYAQNELVCISGGVQEGDFFDSGYGAIVDGDSQ